jgi:hypothetical protein
MSAPTVKDLAGAQGKVVLFVASLLQRADIMPMAEFSRLLATFAVTIGETDPGEGQILAAWAREVGELESQ